MRGWIDFGGGGACVCVCDHLLASYICARVVCVCAERWLVVSGPGRKGGGRERAGWAIIASSAPLNTPVACKSGCHSRTHPPHTHTHKHTLTHTPYFHETHRQVLLIYRWTGRRLHVLFRKIMRENWKKHIAKSLRKLIDQGFRVSAIISDTCSQKQVISFPLVSLKTPLWRSPFFWLGLSALAPTQRLTGVEVWNRSWTPARWYHFSTGNSSNPSVHVGAWTRSDRRLEHAAGNALRRAVSGVSPQVVVHRVCRGCRHQDQHLFFFWHDKKQPTNKQPKPTGFSFFTLKKIQTYLG